MCKIASMHFQQGKCISIRYVLSANIIKHRLHVCRGPGPLFPDSQQQWPWPCLHLSRCRCSLPCHNYSNLSSFKLQNPSPTTASGWRPSRGRTRARPPSSSPWRRTCRAPPAPSSPTSPAPTRGADTWLPDDCCHQSHSSLPVCRILSACWRSKSIEQVFISFQLQFCWLSLRLFKDKNFGKFQFAFSNFKPMLGVLIEYSQQQPQVVPCPNYDNYVGGQD